MITINEKLYVTKEINNILVDYANKIVLKKLLIEFSFYLKNDKKKITDLIQGVAYYLGNSPSTELQEEMRGLINFFLQKLNKNEMTTLYFWVIDRNYEMYATDAKQNIDSNEDNFEFKFGRELALKLYEPENNWLDDDLHEALNKLLLDFTSEFDFSLIDKHTKKNILDTLEVYCS